ncbi:MAG: alkaline phosphatase family protein [Nanoarchaeota archaeon]|nr:alkaline phosphatase family protein [Nanoarchaeota archaeon]
MRKVVVLFLDGGTWDIIDPLLKVGKLPNLDKLIKKGTRATIKSTIPPLTSFVWPSILTGKGAGKHGVYSFYSLDEKNNLKLNQEYNSSNKYLWDFLTEKNIRSIVFDIPKTFPPKKMDGIMISYFPPSCESDFTFPSSYKTKLLKKFPHYNLKVRSRAGEDEGSKNKFFKEVCDFLKLRFEVIDDLIKNEQWDFFITDIMATDIAQHWFWKNIDKSHPYYSKGPSSDYINEIYQLIDSFIGRLREELPKNTLFIVASDHGFGKYIKDINLNKWLKDQGYLVFKKNTSFRKIILNKIGLTPSKISQIILNLRLGFLLKYLKRKTMKNMIHSLSLSYNNIDMSKTIAYSYGYCGPIYLNKKLLGSKYEEKRLEIIERLKLIKDPIYGKILINKIWKKEELYPGPKNEHLPDIILNMQDFSYGCSSSFAFKSDKLFSKPITFKSGDHKVEGFFIINGEGVKKGGNYDLDVVDFLPTLLYMYDCDIPKDLDGKPRLEFFEKNFKL